MTNQAVIPVEVVRDRIAAIDTRLGELKRELNRIKEEEVGLATERSILTKLEQMAVSPSIHPRPNGARKGRKDSGPAGHPGEKPPILGNEIPDGKVATPIILQMIHERPGITSIEIFDALESRVTKEGPKGARKFLADLIWELGHRKKLFRKSNGSLYLTEQGGES